METATIPSLRVMPDLRQATENILREGETLASLMEASLRAEIRHREVQQDFPFTCRKAILENPLLREMSISSGTRGYVVLFEIENNKT